MLFASIREGQSGLHYLTLAQGIGTQKELMMPQLSVFSKESQANHSIIKSEKLFTIATCYATC